MAGRSKEFLRRLRKKYGLGEFRKTRKRARPSARRRTTRTVRRIPRVTAGVPPQFSLGQAAAPVFPPIPVPLPSQRRNRPPSYARLSVVRIDDPDGRLEDNIPVVVGVPPTPGLPGVGTVFRAIASGLGLGNLLK